MYLVLLQKPNKMKKKLKVTKDDNSGLLCIFNKVVTSLNIPNNKIRFIELYNQAYQVVIINILRMCHCGHKLKTIYKAIFR